MDEPEASYRDFVERALPIIKDWIVRNGIPRTNYRRIRFQEERRGWDPITVSEPQFFQMVFTLTRDSDVSQIVLDSLVHAKKIHCDTQILSEPVVHDNDGNRITDLSDENYLFSTQSDLMMPLTHALDLHESADITVDDVMSVYEKYRATWDGKVPSSIEIVPLQSLTLADATEELELSEGVHIAKFDNSVKNTLSLIDGFERRETLMEISRADFALFISKYWGTNDAESLDIIRRAICAIRLCTSASFGARIRVSQYPLSWTVRSSTGSLVRTNVAWGSSRVEMTASDVGQVAKAYSKLASVNDQHLAIANDRYIASFDARTMEDIVIDLAIGLECCLLPKEREELKLRLALRGAYLLSPSESPGRIFDCLRLLYDFRSKIVHNGQRFDQIVKSESNKLSKTCDSAVTPQSVIDEFREVTRKILSRLTTDEVNYESLKNAAEKWDYEIVDLMARSGSG